MKHTLESNAVALKRWRTRLKRALTAIDKLEKQRKRLEAAPVKEVMRHIRERAAAPQIVGDNVNGFEPVPIPASTLVQAVRQVVKPEQAIPDDDDGIPSFLRRTPDPAIEQVREEQAETKRRKAKGRIEKMKAKQRGDLKKMPLSGKAALQMIDEG